MMPPHKSQKPRGPPRTPPELRAIKVGVSFRADQRAALSRLRADRRLSLLCQKAVDQDAELESLPDGVRDDGRINDTNIRVFIDGASGHSARISRAEHFPPRMVL